MKRVLKGCAGAGLGLVVLFGALLGYARHAANAAYDHVWDLPDEPVPIPYPAVAAEGAPAPSEADLRAAAVERGRALATVRLGCHECHGEDLGGHVVMDVGPVGAMIGPNITEGEGSVTRGYEPADWVRLLRHGVGRNRTTSFMPCIDTAGLADQEISDLAVYVRSFPPVSRSMPPPRLGPVMWVQYGLGGVRFSAFEIDHQAARPKVPPTAAPTREFGEHLAQACKGCHGPRFAGGAIPGGDPKWPPAANLTRAGSLSGWSSDDFVRALSEGKRPDGSDINQAMPWQAFRGMSEVEKRAMFEYLRSLDPLPTGTR